MGILGRVRFLRLTASRREESQLPHPAQAVLQRPEIHEPTVVLYPEEEHFAHLHTLACGRLAQELALVRARAPEPPL